MRIDLGIDTGTFEVRPGDRVLLTTDGVHGAMSREAMETTMGTDATPQACAESLVAAGMRAGSDDNLTALVVHLHA